MGIEVDPADTHAPPPTKQRYRAKRSNPPTASTSSTTKAKLKSILKSTTPSTSKKQPADGSSTPNLRATKKSKTNSTLHQTVEGNESVQVEGGQSSPEPEVKNQVDPAIQVCRYLLEMFSVPLLRSHATVSLVDRDRLQLYHANRSVILVSSAINFSEGDGKDKFIATIIAFHCLSLEQNGILETRVPRNAQLVSDTKIGEAQVVQRGSELHFAGIGEDKPFKVTLEDVISRDPAMVGRSTLVVNATSEQWPKALLVVKISWPTSSRASEAAFIERAREKATGKHAWAAKHLPRVYYAEDVVFSTNSTLESVARLFDNPKFEGKEFVYERRTLRIIIQERLYPLKSLASAKDIGQVFVDVACSTCVPFACRLPLTDCFMQFIVGSMYMLGSFTVT